MRSAASGGNTIGWSVWDIPAGPCEFGGDKANFPGALLCASSRIECLQRENEFLKEQLLLHRRTFRDCLNVVSVALSHNSPVVRVLATESISAAVNVEISRMRDQISAYNNLTQSDKGKDSAQTTQTLPGGESKDKKCYEDKLRYTKELFESLHAALKGTSVMATRDTSKSLGKDAKEFLDTLIEWYEQGAKDSPRLFFAKDSPESLVLYKLVSEPRLIDELIQELFQFKDPKIVEAFQIFLEHYDPQLGLLMTPATSTNCANKNNNEDSSCASPSCGAISGGERRRLRRRGRRGGRKHGGSKKNSLASCRPETSLTSTGDWQLPLFLSQDRTSWAHHGLGPGII